MFAVADTAEPESPAMTNMLILARAELRRDTLDLARAGAFAASLRRLVRRLRRAA